MNGERLYSADVAVNWWQDLISKKPGRKAARSRLRRAVTPLEVIQEREALRLIARLPYENQDRVAILAGILATVTESDDQRVANTIGRTSLDDELSLMSENRFRRLLQANDNDLMAAMRRLIRLTKGKANVYDLSYTVLRWGDGVKRRWLFDYYGVAGSVAESKATAHDSALTPPST